MARRGSLMIVTGVPELDANLQTLAGPAATRISKAALSAGLRVLAKAQKAAAPVGKTGATAASIGSRLIAGQGAGYFLAKAGINVGKRSKAGTLIASAAFRNTARRAKRIAAGLTTARRGARARAAAKAAPHAHLVAMGTGPRYTGATAGLPGLAWKLRRRVASALHRPGGRGYRGKMPANPFIRHAFEREINAVKFAIREAAAKGVAREVNKLGKKTGAPVAGIS